LNSQGRSHTLLRRARLPIPPRPQRVFSNRGMPKPLKYHTLLAEISI